MSGESAVALEDSKSIEYWATRWKEQRIGWQINNVNPTLLDFTKTMSKKIFIPLCGKTYDIAYLYSLGHEVFGIEAVKDAIEGLNERDNLNLRFNPEDSTYCSPDGRIRIYMGDIMECPIEKWGPFDYVWDRASLIAMDYSQRDEYVDVIRRSVSSNGTYSNFQILLETVCYKKHSHPGPPRSVDENDMKELYSDWANIEVLRKVPIEETFPGIREMIPVGLPIEGIVYLLTPKK